MYEGKRMESRKLVLATSIDFCNVHKEINDTLAVSPLVL